MKKRHTILVSGATGFIGGRVVEGLYFDGSCNVRAGIRQWSSAARIARFPVEMMLCDIMNEEQIAQSMVSVSAVVHCAYEDSRSLIVQGTRNMLEAAHRSGVKRFVHLSTAEIYGNVRGEINETFPYQYTGTEYADAKIEAEKLCWDFYDKGLPISVLRPSIVYGPFSKVWTVSMAARLQSGNWGTFKDYGEGICNLVYVDDLVSAILLAVSHENAVGEVFNINGPDTITWNQYFEKFSEGLGLPKLDKIPSHTSRFKSAVMDRIRAVTGYFVKRYRDSLMDAYMRFGPVRKVMRLIKTSLVTTPSSGELRLYSRGAIYVAAKAQNMLGYKPKFDLDAGLNMSVLWLDHHGFLGQPPSLKRKAARK